MPLSFGEKMALVINKDNKIKMGFEEKRYNKIRGCSFPEITVVMIVSRVDFIDDARESIYNQVYPSAVELIEIPNFEKKRTIGDCWNEGVKKAKYDYIFFMGDDDYLENSYLISLMCAYHNFDNKDRVVCLTSGLTLFGNNKPLQRHFNKFPTGIWKKNYLLENKFDEKLKKLVDSNMFERTNEMQYKYDICALTSNAGYYYRQHGNNVSGDKYKMWGKNGKQTKNKSV